MELLLERAGLAAAVALLLIGAVSAWTSANVAKRIIGLVVANVAALIALAVLGAPQGLLIAGVAVAFAQVAIGTALLVRLQESYGGAEAGEFDAADAASEPKEPSA